MTAPTIALWEPDITPPDEWLFSGILYQDRISTFAPSPDIPGADANAANRLRHALGDLYQPLSLGDALMATPRYGIVEELHRRLESWHMWASRRPARGPDDLVQAWLGRSRRGNAHIDRDPLRGPDVSRYPWLAPNRLDAQIPRGMATIAAGKLNGAAVEFLATEGGLWMSRNPASPWAGTLVGPEHIVDDVLRTVALWHCSENPGWVPMSGPTRDDFTEDYEPVDPDELVALALRALLPVPTHASIEDVVSFRRQHEDELGSLRATLAAELPAIESADDIKDVLLAMERHLAEPLAQVTRALELDSKLGFKHTAQTTFHKFLQGTHTAVFGLAATGVAIPVFGSTYDLTAFEAATGGGAALAVAGIAGGVAAAWINRRRMQRPGPFQYIYDVGRHFGRA